MTTHDDHLESIVRSQEVLATHRRTLAHLLRQEAIFGIFTPPYIAHGIADTREEIAKLKVDLRAADGVVGDEPGDLPGTAPIERYGRRLRMGLIFGMIVVLVLIGLGISGGVAGMQTRLDAWGIVPAIQPEQPGEILLVIAPFYYTEGNRNTEAHREIQRTIQAAAQDAKLTNLRVTLAPAPLRADDRDGAERMGGRYNASLVVWGEDTGARVSVSFLNRRGTPETAARDVMIGETERTQIANPPAYNRFITNDMPRQISFLSLFAIGQAYNVSNKSDDATRIIERAVAEVMPQASIEGIDAAYFMLGWLYQISRKEPEKAISVYDQVIKLKPDFADAYTNRGVARLDQGNLVGALFDFEQAIKLQPDNAEIYINRGVAHAEQGDLTSALADFDQAIKLQPDDALSYYNRGKAHTEQGDLTSALADFDQAIKLKPDDADAYYNRGNTRTEQGDLTGALADFDQAIKLQPDFATAYYWTLSIR